MSTSTPRLSAETCGPWPTPPKTVWMRRPAASASGRRAASIWLTSSRVGARISARGRRGAARPRLGGEPGDDGERERVGLAGAGAAAAEQVLAGERVGQGRRLDRGGRGDAVGSQHRVKGGGHAEVGEVRGHERISPELAPPRTWVAVSLSASRRAVPPAAGREAGLGFEERGGLPDGSGSLRCARPGARLAGPMRRDYGFAAVLVESCAYVKRSTPSSILARLMTFRSTR